MDNVKKMRFVGHRMKGSSEELIQVVLEEMIDGKRTRGRRRKILGDNTKKWAKFNNSGEAKRGYENLNVWRKMVHNLRIEDVT